MNRSHTVTRYVSNYRGRPVRGCGGGRMPARLVLASIRRRPGA
ncbi:hypothetical protein ACFPM0_18810 [Pseudonocardia sulfidoxydans]